MKTVFLYDASWQVFGGGEKYLCVIADVLAQTSAYRPVLLIDAQGVTLDGLRRYFNVPMENVAAVTCTRRDVPRLLGTADCAIVESNVRPLGLQARTNIKILQMPLPAFRIAQLVPGAAPGGIRAAAKRISQERLLREARKADLILVYSNFVRTALQKSHALDARVLYPPIDDIAAPMIKENLVLSVGRVFRGPYNDKRYDVLIEAFRALRDRLPNYSWEYRIVGSCGSDKASRRYLAELQKAAEGHPVYFHLNASYQDLCRYYNRATLFWHAAGCGVDETEHPENTEHFGMSTVEAMSAGCIPVVINRGGQKEIVSHGKSGYLWNTVEELVATTADLIMHPERHGGLREEARNRFHDFDRSRFAAEFLTLIDRCC
jgi:glycosyltransferase involved in cell wall biosynthesis